ncbi:MAG: GTPase domain-containing protein [Hyphomicrobiaceae bacterium]|nr:GTPase domain-containing protein [Hyphomicrobiaceae bacterium]
MNSGTGGLSGRVVETWARLIGRPRADLGDEQVANTAAAQAPVVWLLGKVQAGKSSIVAALTGASEAQVGAGFKGCTASARVFDFPAAAPVIRFLDTRGLGEAGYDPQADLAVAEAAANVVLVVMRAMDPQQDRVIDVVAAVRARHPGWPVVVAQTALHDAYEPGGAHALPYPFEDGRLPPDARVPAALVRSLAHQRETIRARIAGTGSLHFVPLDFTRDDDGYTPRFYGLDALIDTLAHAAPAAVVVSLAEIRAGIADSVARDVGPTILGYAGAAAAADVVPVAGALAVPGIQAKLLHALAAHYGVPWDRRALAEFGACLGAGLVSRLVAQFGIREIAKLVPGYGQTVGAAAAAVSSFATTYALGRAALVFLERRRRGQSDPEAVADAYRQALVRAFELARERGLGGGDAGGKGTPA